MSSRHRYVMFAGLHRQVLYGGLRIGMYEPVKRLFVGNEKAHLCAFSPAASIVHLVLRQLCTWCCDAIACALMQVQ